MDTQVIQKRIYETRGQRVMLDYDLAILYETETKRLNQQVKRNIDRFPEDFMFQLSQAEWQHMRSHNVTACVEADKSASAERQKKRNTAALPYAFTEHGVTMLAGILRSQKAEKLGRPPKDRLQ